MGVTTYDVSEDGKCRCSVCRKVFELSDVHSCSYCDKWICKYHAKKIRGVEGYVCPKCYNFIKSKK